MNFKIKDARPEDVKVLRAIVKDAWIRIYPSEKFGINVEDIEKVDWFNPQGLERRRREIIEDRKTIRVFVLKDEKNKIVGFSKIFKGLWLW